MKTRDPEANACVIAVGISRYRGMPRASATAAKQAKRIVRKLSQDEIRIFIVFFHNFSHALRTRGVALSDSAWRAYTVLCIRWNSQSLPCLRLYPGTGREWEK